jgi:hypothetical protein
MMEELRKNNNDKQTKRKFLEKGFEVRLLGGIDGPGERDECQPRRSEKAGDKK